VSLQAHCGKGMVTEYVVQVGEVSEIGRLQAGNLK